MAVSKIIFGGDTLVDLTGDTVTADKLAQGVTAHGKDGELITGTSTLDVDSSDATVTADEILNTKTAYARGAKITGAMPNNGSVSGKITTKDGDYTIPIGYHDGSGKVAIDDAEKAKLVAGNIRSGVTILGILGTMSGLESVKAQSKSVTPSASAQTIVPDEGFNYLSQVTVAAIPYQTTENSAGGTTVTIG